MPESPARPSRPDGWRVHRRAQRARWRRATPAQRLAWLEEAFEFAHRAGALPSRDRPGTGGFG